MFLLNPLLLAAGLACIAIPILIHLLLRQRRKPVRWAAMRFVLEAYRRQRRRLKLQQLLLLACRCLVLALLALALGRPLLESSGVLGGEGGRTIYLLVDNALASSVRGAEGGTALDRHRAAAEQILGGLESGDRVSVVALAAPATGLVLPGSTDAGAVQEILRGIEPGDGAADLRGGLDLVAADVEADPSATGERVVVVLSDFLAGSADTAAPLPPALAELDGVRLVASPPAETAPGNVQVIGVDVPGVLLTASGERARRSQVRVQLRRTGAGVDERAVTTLRLRATPIGDAEPAAPRTATAEVRWEPGERETTASVPLDVSAQDAGVAGQALVQAEIDRDAIEADNRFGRAVRLRDALRVGVIARRRFGTPTMGDLGSPDWLRFAVAPDASTPVEIVDVDPASLDAPALAAVDAALLPEPDLVAPEGWSLLGDFVDAGGLLLVAPPVDATVHLWPDALARELGLDWRIQREPAAHDDAPLRLGEEPPGSSLLGVVGAEIPELGRKVEVYRTLGFEEPPAGAEVLLAFADGEPLLVARSAEGPGRGLALYLATAPDVDWTNLPLTPLMVPLMQELLRQGVGRAVGDADALAGRAALAPAGAARLVTGGGEEIEVAASGLVAAPLRRAGLYRGIDTAGRPRGVLAVNADPAGGYTAPRPRDVAETWLGGALGDEAEVAWMDAAEPARAIARQTGGSPISLPLLVAALVLACLELVLARLFSYGGAAAGRATAVPAGAVR